MTGPDTATPQMRPDDTASELSQFNELYRKYYDGFVRFADSYLRDTAVAEDLVAESFMAFWNHRQTMSPDSNIRAYLLTTLKNKCLNQLKQREYQKQRLQDMSEVSRWDLQTRISTLDACNPEEVFSDEVQQLVDKAIRQLPLRTLQVFQLSRYEHKTNKEIAEIQGITVKGVEFHITKALDLLRISLRDYLPALILLRLL